MQISTVPYDPRFPATNQARNCYTRYNEYYKCIAEHDEESPDCKFYQKAYRSICPSEWVRALPGIGPESPDLPRDDSTNSEYTYTTWDVDW